MQTHQHFHMYTCKYTDIYIDTYNIHVYAGRGRHTHTHVSKRQPSDATTASTITADQQTILEELAARKSYQAMLHRARMSLPAAKTDVDINLHLSFQVQPWSTNRPEVGSREAVLGILLEYLLEKRT